MSVPAELHVPSVTNPTSTNISLLQRQPCPSHMCSLLVSPHGTHPAPHPDSSRSLCTRARSKCPDHNYWPRAESPSLLLSSELSAVLMTLPSETPWVLAQQSGGTRRSFTGKVSGRPSDAVKERKKKCMGSKVGHIICTCLWYKHL